ncbi:hypothetical protein ES288_A05G322700v1 [Gossypium darwinii]|uniref:Uncharacterized protein n=1 Tax=Gossypium darwinii TaxID=34276 RepID=A0A5D2GLX2_GOSDA|nr:hypothetical protein ES288_A05G322700v1 [Gossypium darwinii]
MTEKGLPKTGLRDDSGGVREAWRRACGGQGQA